jgi:hypothetical protein
VPVTPREPQPAMVPERDEPMPRVLAGQGESG